MNVERNIYFGIMEKTLMISLYRNKEKMMVSWKKVMIIVWIGKVKFEHVIVTPMFRLWNSISLLKFIYWMEISVLAIGGG